jgi:hypothetical protein
LTITNYRKSLQIKKKKIQKQKQWKSKTTR